MSLILSTLIAFLIGSIPFGYFAGRLKGIDIRQHGSGNIGATNVLRVMGKPIGIPVFALDVLKGFIPAWIAQHYFFDYPQLAPVLAAIAAVLGHSFTPWLGFKGGKGVATSAGAVLALMPIALAASVSAWFILFKTTRYVAVASIGAACALPIAAGVEMFCHHRFDPRYEFDPYLLTVALMLSTLVIVRHRSNIKRLMAGTENRFQKKGLRVQRFKGGRANA